MLSEELCALYVIHTAPWPLCILLPRSPSSTVCHPAQHGRWILLMGQHAFLVPMWPPSCAGRFSEEGSSPKKRRLQTGPGYSAKTAGFPLRQGPLSGSQTDQQGLPLDPQQVGTWGACPRETLWAAWPQSCLRPASKASPQRAELLG